LRKKQTNNNSEGKNEQQQNRKKKNSPEEKKKKQDTSFCTLDIYDYTLYTVYYCLRYPFPVIPMEMNNY